MNEPQAALLSLLLLGSPSRHPFFFFWSCRFHCPDREWARGSDVRLPVHERDQLSAPEYRKRLYQVLELWTPIVRFPRTPSTPVWSPDTAATPVLSGLL